MLMRFLIGGGTVLVVSLLAQKGLPQYAGIIMTFPVITFISLLFVPEDSVMSLAKYGLLGLVLAFVYITSCIVLYHLGLPRTVSVFTSLLLTLLIITSVIIWHCR